MSRPEVLYARPECPEPGRWQAPDGIATEVDVSVFIGALVRLLKPDLVLETGSYQGDTTEQIGRALAAEGRGRCVSIERYGDLAAIAAERCAGLPVEVIAGDSRAYVPPSPIDLLFLDSEYDARIEECRQFRAWASPRCLIVAHDTVVAEYRANLDRLAAEGLVRPWMYLGTPRGLGITSYRDGRVP